MREMCKIADLFLLNDKHDVLTRQDYHTRYKEDLTQIQCAGIFGGTAGGSGKDGSPRFGGGAGGASPMTGIPRSRAGKPAELMSEAESILDRDRGGGRAVTFSVGSLLLCLVLGSGGRASVAEMPGSGDADREVVKALPESSDDEVVNLYSEEN